MPYHSSALPAVGAPGHIYKDEGSQSLAAGPNLSETLIILQSKHTKCKTESLNENALVFSYGHVRQLRPAHKLCGGLMRKEHGLGVQFSI